MKRLIACVIVVSLAAPAAFADVINIDFSEVGSKHTSIFDGMHNANTGGEAADKLGGNGDYLYALYQWDMSALAGATITSATFSIQDRWWPSPFNVELRRVDTPLEWQQGDGTHDGPQWRWENDNGAGDYMVDWDETSSTGHDWAGNAYSYLSSGSTRVSSAIADFIDNDAVGNGQTTVFTITSLVQNWADGTWANRGLALSSANASSPGLASLLNPTVTIDYTEPIPEPGTLLLTSTGIVGVAGWIRRRRHR